MVLTFQSARITVENALRDALLLAHGRRLPSVDSPAALAQVPALGLREDDLRFVVEAERTYRFRRAEASAADGDVIVAPADLMPNAPGRWVKTDAAQAMGYLERCELYNEDEDQETMTERLLSKKPAILISFEGARHQPVSNRAGALYWYIASYRLLVISTNMRGADAAWHGSARSDERLVPGTAAMLGDAKQVLAGSDLGLDGAVERVELGEERPVVVALAKRTVVEALDITVWSTVSKDDDEIAPLDGADVHDELDGSGGAPPFSDDAEVDFNP